ncbi:FAD-dependent oxidoreductase [Streptomyces sp. NPDC057062]|uniref:FAD-dependent oxidoreductase n=1 Tax=Streptomyces sp. NPDC057062 TaxID=3346011 RepID=UPI00362A3E60
MRTTAHGAIEVDEYLRTSRPHIFAMGDVNGGPQFTYISLDDYRIVADQLSGEGKRSTTDRVAVPYTLFMTPPLARVGLTENEARAAGRSVRVASKAVAAMAAMPRASIVGEVRGLMKFVVDAETDEILGAALLSVDAQELVNTVALAMRSGVTASGLRDAIWTHPSSTEAFQRGAGDCGALTPRLYRVLLTVRAWRHPRPSTVLSLVSVTTPLEIRGVACSVRSDRAPCPLPRSGRRVRARAWSGQGTDVR